MLDDTLLSSFSVQMAQGTKRGRGSPKLEEGKDIFEGVEISDEIAKKLETMQRDTARVELAIGTQCFFMWFCPL